MDRHSTQDSESARGSLRKIVVAIAVESAILSSKSSRDAVVRQIGEIQIATQDGEKAKPSAHTCIQMYLCPDLVARLFGRAEGRFEKG